MSGRERRLDRIIGLLDTVIPSLLLGFLLLLILWGTAERSLDLGVRLHWLMEFSNIAFTWIVFLGAAGCFRRGIAITVESFFLLMPAAMRRLVYVGVNLTVLVTCVVVAYYGYHFTMRMWPQSTSMLGISQGWRVLSLPVGMALIALTAVRELACIWTGQYRWDSVDGH